MKFIVEQKDIGVKAEVATYQWPFAKVIQCNECPEKTDLVMLIDDDEKELAGQRLPKVKIWPHDSTAIALYLCTYCGHMMAEWNQA